MTHHEDGMRHPAPTGGRGIMAGRPRHVRAAALSAPIAALLLVALLAVGAVDFLKRDERTDQAAATAQSGLVADTDGRGGTSGEFEQGRQLGAATGAVAALLVAAVALVVLLFAGVGLGVLLFGAALWAAMRSRQAATRWTGK